MRFLVATLLFLGCHGETVSEATPTDALPSDAPLGDAVVEDSAPLDVASEGGIDTAPGCAGIFCADFDTVETPESGWSRKVVSGTGVLAFDAATFRSGPRGLHVAWTRDLSRSSYAQLEKKMSLSTTTMHVEANLRISAVPTERAPVLRLTRGAGKGALVVFDGSPQLEVLGFAGSERIVPFTKPFPTGTWALLALEIDFATTPTGAVRVLLDGSLVAEAKNVATTDDVAGETLVQIGLGSSGTLAPFDAWFDDVLVR